MNAALDIKNHPCFNEEAKGVCGRIHLPVAPGCNIKCNYCNRKYDCVNESRPGVASAVLSPVQASAYLNRVAAKAPSITVVGIAGPGDPFANAGETLETMRLIRENHPEMLLCVSTNGLGLPAYIDQIAALGVTHVTVTVNAVDPEIGEKIYAWVKDGKIIYRGRRGAELLLERQLEAIRGLKGKGIMVKVNTIVIPDVNEDHVNAVAEKMAELGVDALNVMAMVPNAGTPFGDLPEPGPTQMAELREKAEKHLPQIRHCKRCRADAVGLLGEDRCKEFKKDLDECAVKIPLETQGKPYVAVATMEGALVNQHLGEARRFQIWGQNETGFKLIEEREAPPKGDGVERWRALAKTLEDCRAVLVSGFGDIPAAVMTSEKVLPIEMSGFIDMGLKAVFSGNDTKVFKRRRTSCAKGLGCKGDGAGCG